MQAYNGMRLRKSARFGMIPLLHDMAHRLMRQGGIVDLAMNGREFLAPDGAPPMFFMRVKVK